MSKFKIGDVVMLNNPEKTHYKCTGKVVGVLSPLGPLGDRYKIRGVRGAVPLIVPEEDLVHLRTAEDLVQGCCKTALNSVYGVNQQYMSYLKTAVDSIRNMYYYGRKCKGHDDVFVPKIKNVILNDPAVIIMWEDGTKTVVRAQGEKFDPEKGLAMAISKKALGNKHSYYGVFLKNIPGLKKKGAK